MKSAPSRPYAWTMIAGLLLLASIPLSAQGGGEELRLLRENRALKVKLDSLQRIVDKYDKVDQVWAQLSGLETDDATWGAGISSLDRDMPEDERLVASSLSDLFPEMGIRYDRSVYERIGEYSRGKNAGILAGAFSRLKKRMPGFEQVFRKHGVPVELIPLCVVESAVSRDALSPAGAAGMWQLMPETARGYGLRVDSEIDERYYVDRSTEAAARFLLDLKKTLGSWPLAVMAYNCGAARVRKAVIDTGSSDPWRVLSSLPEETQAYLPSLLAVGYLYSATARK